MVNELFYRFRKCIDKESRKQINDLAKLTLTEDEMIDYLGLVIHWLSGEEVEPVEYLTFNN